MLESQCKKYFNNPETKESVIAAFQKLIDKGYIRFIEDLPEDIKKKFLHKEVQYYLPWRIQFKPGSATTNTRPVFDASSKTPGGESLNNLLAKGSSEMVRLIDMMLDWRMGPSV